MGILLPQAVCCCRCSVRLVDIEILEQVVPVLVLLLLVLLDVGDCVPHVCLPLRMLMKCVLYGVLRFFNGVQPIVVAVVLHLLVMVASARERHTSSLVVT